MEAKQVTRKKQIPSLGINHYHQEPLRLSFPSQGICSSWNKPGVIRLLKKIIVQIPCLKWTATNKSICLQLARTIRSSAAQPLTMRASALIFQTIWICKISVPTSQISQTIIRPLPPSKMPCRLIKLYPNMRPRSDVTYSEQHWKVVGD